LEGVLDRSAHGSGGEVEREVASDQVEAAAVGPNGESHRHLPSEEPADADPKEEVPQALGETDGVSQEDRRSVLEVPRERDHSQLCQAVEDSVCDQDPEALERVLGVEEVLHDLEEEHAEELLRLLQEPKGEDDGELPEDN